MDDILLAGTKLKWTEEQATFEEIEQKFGLPQIVKLSQNTSADYNLPEAEPVLLLSRRNPVRMIAQTIEEGHYVMGKQVEIPSEYSGLFKITSDFERDDTQLMTFRSIQEVADVFPSKVYIQEQLTVTLANEDSSGKFSTVVLQKGDELTIVSKGESQAGQAATTKPASRFKSKVRRTQHNVLIVHCTRLDESLSLPLSIQGWFATRSPLLVNLMERGGVISLQQIMEQANFPLTVIVSTNSTRSVKDEFVLRTGMHLKLIGLEEHDLILAITPFQRIVELSVTDVTFMLPSVLTSLSPESNKEEMAELTQYQTHVQSAYMNSKLQNSPSNVDEYSKSVRFHIPRNKRLTKPKPLNSNAFMRSLVLNPTHLRKRMNVGGSTKGLSAIQLLSNQQSEGSIQRNGRGSRKGNTSRRQLPVPGLPAGQTANPPLPPRNSPTSPHLSALTTSPNNYDPNLQNAPPVPPKFRSPTLPALSTSRAVPCIPTDMPTRPAPIPNVPDVLPESNVALSHPAVDLRYEDFALRNGEHPHEEEDIWEEFQPPTTSQRDSIATDLTAPQTDHLEVSPTEQQTQEVSESVVADATTESTPIPNYVFQEPSPRSESPCFVLASLKEPSVTSNNVISTSQPYDNVVLALKKPSTYDNVELNIKLPENNAPTPRASADQLPRMAEENGDGDEDVVSNVIDDVAIPVCETPPMTSSAINTTNMLLINGVNSLDRPSIKFNTSNDEPKFKDRFTSPAKRYVHPPPGWFPPDDATSLTVDELATSLRFIGFSEDVVCMFNNERIDGALLVELSEEILEQDFMLGKLYRFKIKRFIEGWRPKLSRPDTSVLLFKKFHP